VATDNDDEQSVNELILELVRETRDDVRDLLKSDARTRERLVQLEAWRVETDKRLDAAPYASPPGVKRDVGMTAGAAALVVAVMQILQAFGVGVPAQAAPPPAPPAIVAAP
jgi:hypothetical protein